MICNVEKLVSLREAKLMTQEKLAAQARVNRRTIQRMEAGEPVSPEIVQNVASELGVEYTEIIDVNKSSDNANEIVTLREEKSGLRIVRGVSMSRYVNMKPEFEPWPNQLTQVKYFMDFIWGLHMFNFENYEEYEKSLDDNIQMEKAAELNFMLGLMEELEPEGLHVLYGEYIRLGNGWSWTTDKGWRDNKLVTPVKIAAIRITSLDVKIIKIPFTGKPVPENFRPDLDDDVPF
jgi:transcriptional regulator with XRE-family HTH domain